MKWLAECSAEALGAALRVVMPELSGCSITIPELTTKQDPPWHSSSAAVGEQFIAKFAWSRPAALRLAREIGVLTALAAEPKVPFLPEVVASSMDPLLLVTRRVPGTSLFEVVGSIDRDRAGRQLACFLAALHQPAVLKRAGRYKIADRTDAILAALRSPQLGQPPALTAAYAATVRSLIAVITTLNEQVRALQGEVEAHFGQHPDADIYLSKPGLGAITGARVLGEFGDDPHRYACAKARRNYAATSPITRASGKKKIVAARFVHNDRLIDALMIQAFAALRVSPGARTFYDDLRARGIEHNDALRRLANRLVGVLHGCLKTHTCYDEATAWGHRENTGQSPVAA